MKRFLRSVTALLTAASLLCSAQAELLREISHPLGDNAAVTETMRQNDKYIRNEHLLTLHPGDDLRPAVIYGSTLYGKSTMDAIEAYPKQWGFALAAGVNAGFFDMGNGLPMGMVLTDGCVRSSGTAEAIGFRKDGSAIIGYPKLSVDVTFPDGTTLKSIHCNKALTTSNGMVLYTRDYDRHTKNEVAAFHAVLTPDCADLRLNSRITAKVTELIDDTADCAIPEGGFVLAMAEGGDYDATLTNTLKKLAPKDELVFSVTIGDGWGNVDSACAGMGLLVLDGVAQTSFSLNSASSRAARTAVGLRADGELVFYTVDSVGGSTGLTLPELAQRMAELGCVTALNLDGGGSTALRVTYPGMGAPQTVNRPSDGKLRKCANFIFLLRDAAEVGEPTRLFLYPDAYAALPGGQVTLAAYAADEHYNPVPLPEPPIYATENGEAADGIFTAERAGDAVIAATAGNLTAQVTVPVVDVPASVAVSPRTVQCKPGEAVSLTAGATYAGTALAARNESFAWTCDSTIGTVDEHGVFTAAQVYEITRGQITCAVGGVAATVDVTILPELPFADVEGHWAAPYIINMYDAGVLKGSVVDGVPRFRPDDGMTRQEFLVALTRYLAMPPTEAELPFADSDAIAPWALDAVCAAYGGGLLSGSLRQGVLYCDPNSVITRQETMVLLRRTMAGEPADPDILAAYPDEANVADWARQSLADLLTVGVISGTGDGRLAPTDPVTRGQVAKMLTLLPQ